MSGHQEEPLARRRVAEVGSVEIGRSASTASAGTAPVASRASSNWQVRPHQSHIAGTLPNS
jgi:hypothetical protein